MGSCQRIFPCTILVDSREQAPFTFADLHGDAKDGNCPLVISTRRHGLPTGDYSLEGFMDRIAIERKSLPDLFGTLGQGRDRFERELERLSAIESAHVVIEASWYDILLRPPARSQLLPKVVHRSIIYWTHRFPSVHWWTLCGRRLAEITTFRILESFWKLQQRKTNVRRNAERLGQASARPAEAAPSVRHR